MKQNLESIVKKGKMIALTGLIYLTMGCASSKFYIEPKVGVMVAGAAKEQDYKPSATIGGACGISGKVIGLEAGLDYFNSSGKYVETKHRLSKVDISLNLSKPTVKAKSNLVMGIGSLNEHSTINIPQFGILDEMKNKNMLLEFGYGLLIGNKIDGKVTYLVLPGSENVKGMINFNIGYRFTFGNKK